jgi:thiaminase/transcriptional activator TenA
MTTRSERIREAAGERLAESARVRFVVEASDGSLAADAFAAYLAIEEDFVHTAARIAGFALWAQEDATIGELHARTVSDLVGPQRDYFRSVRGRHPGTPQNTTRALASAELSAHVLGVTRDHGYPAAMISMLAAETLYRDWCAAAEPPAGSDLATWIGLHTDAVFLDQVTALERIVDGLPGTVPDADAIRWFTAMLDAEDAFHDSVYQENE